tara:strand:- start:44 stop:520 length:477 start_codon:yes stop_codon:yes gene_type:complete
MKKDHLPIWPSDTNKGGAKSIEVFFLKDPLLRVVDDAGCDVDSGKYVAGPPHEYHHNLGELDVNENSAGEGAHSFYMCDTGPHEGYVCDEEGFISAIEGCCPVGHKGHQGERGYVEEDVYKLILTSLDKALPDAKESFREVVADGIAKKITKYMSGEE